MAAQQQQQFSSDDALFQLGRMATPLHLISTGSPFDDPKKNTATAQVMVLDQDTFAEITMRELEVSSTYPNMELKSCIGDLVPHPVAGEVGGHPLRVKMTKNKKCYRAHGAGAASSLDSLHCGHTVVLQCRSLPWTYKNTCGITIYANLVRGTGESPTSWAPAAAASDVVWA